MNGLVTSSDREDMIKEAFEKKGINLFLYQLGEKKQITNIENNFFEKDELNYLNNFKNYLNENNINFCISTVGYDNLILIDAQLKNLFRNKELFLGQNFEATSVCYNKALTQAYLKLNEIETTDGTLITSKKELLEVINKKYSDNYIVKKLKTWSGIGMIVCSRKELLENKNIEYPCFIEEFFEAKEVSVNVFSYKSDTIIYPMVYKGQTSLINSHSLSKIRIISKNIEAIDLSTEKKIIEIANKISKILSSDGWFEIEFLVTTNKIMVMEINSRFSGTTRISYMATEINPYEISIDALLKGKVDSEILNSKNVVVEFPFYKKIDCFNSNEIYIHYSSTATNRLGMITAKVTKESLELLRDKFSENLELMNILNNLKL